MGLAKIYQKASSEISDRGTIFLYPCTFLGVPFFTPKRGLQKKAIYIFAFLVVSSEQLWLSKDNASE